MIHKDKFCIWLVDLLMKRDLTLPQIQNAWLRSSANIDGTFLSERSFNRYRIHTEELFNIEIKCKKETRQISRYSIEDNNSIKENPTIEWLLSSYRIAALQDIKNCKEIVYLENPPTGWEYLYDIIEAISSEKALSVLYKSYYLSEFEIIVIPRFVRLFKQRWYMIAEVASSGEIRTYAVERIKEMTIAETDIKRKNTSVRDPQAYYANCYGIIHHDNPVTIRFRVFEKQAQYIESVPIHHSQICVNRGNNFQDFEIYVAPSFDLIQEFLSHREFLTVISPDSLREEMKVCIHKMMDLYAD